MKRGLMLSVGLLIIGVILSACGPSSAELDMTATQVAQDNFFTQTALAPTATATFTTTPNPTDTPLPTATFTPTDTPAPTDTSTVTPTPQPALIAIAPTLDDLPAGFMQMPQEIFSDAQESMPEGTYLFQFQDPENSQFIMGLLFPATTQAEQAVYDAMMAQFIEVFPAALGAELDVQPLTGMDDIGDSRAGITSVGPMMSYSIRWDTLGFRRGDVIAILIVGYLDGDEPLLSMRNFAHLMDDRIMDYQASGNSPGGIY